ncbi:MAG: tRNA lysidine(34) synthetase TilS [Planctomycetia bacterium]|nr:tRNA lysidine(34) synthetase TilS [Planctomycetia bacterium]
MLFSLEKKLAQELTDSRWLQYTTLLGVSGGADSVALLRSTVNLRQHMLNLSSPALPSPPKQNMRGKLIVLHANHQLRGKESEMDADFVKSLCAALHVPCLIHRLNIPQTADGLETDARQARYTFFQKAAAELGARYLFTAHTQNDQVETVLHRILRGTGMTGLQGISKIRMLNHDVTIIRPMLNISRDDVLSYLASLGQAYRVDSSNETLLYTRNRIRHELIPYLKERYNPSLESAILRLSEISKETQDYIQKEVEHLYADAITSRTDHSHRTVFVDLSKLLYVETLIKKELFRNIWIHHSWPMQKMGKNEWDALITLCDNPGHVIIFPGGIRVTHAIKDNHVLLEEPDK